MDAKHRSGTDDVRAAKWLAVFAVSTEPDPAKPAMVAFRRSEGNPSWNPAAVSRLRPLPEPRMHPSLGWAKARVRDALAPAAAD